MFKTAQELKDFILWCQQAKIKAVKVDQIEVQFHELAFLDSYSATEKQLEAEVSAETAQPQAELDKEDEDLLYWSSKQ